MVENTPISDIVDRVSDECPGAREIGFSLPQRYNASAVLFDNLARGNADRVAVRGPAGTLSYDALCALASRAGNALLSLGLAPGERLLLLLDDTPAYPAFAFGAIRAGLVPVLVNTLTPPDLIQFYLADAGARTIVVDATCAGQLTTEALRDTRLETVIVANGDASLPDVGRVLAASSWLPGFSDQLSCAATHRDDMAFWMYSSGSTGRPKGIVHLQHDMAYTVDSYSKHILKLTPDDICFSVPKIFFAYGCGNSMTFPFCAGASSVLLPGKPEPASIFKAIEEHRPTVFFGLPTLYTALANAPEAASADLTSLRLCVSAAEILSNEVAAAWKARSGLEIVEGLGSTEALHIYLSNSEMEKRAGSAGRRVPGYEIRILDRDGREVLDSEEGILWIRGQSNSPAYWNRPNKTAETMRGDWLYTGDRFVRDPEGFHYFRGRADDLIKVSGQWVYPLEVELCLADHNAVREVAVVALELADRRMTLKAFVVPNDAAADRNALTAELQDYVKRTLLPHKYPRIVEYLAELPKTGTGKIDRQALLKSRP
jgi:benzoate-CoA ligase family protein